MEQRNNDDTLRSSSFLLLLITDIRVLHVFEYFVEVFWWEWFEYISLEGWILVHVPIYDDIN